MPFNARFPRVMQITAIGDSFVDRGPVKRILLILKLNSFSNRNGTSFMLPHSSLRSVKALRRARDLERGETGRSSASRCLRRATVSDAHRVCSGRAVRFSRRAPLGDLACIRWTERDCVAGGDGAAHHGSARSGSRDWFKEIWSKRSGAARCGAARRGCGSG